LALFIILLLFVGAWFHTNPIATDRTRAALDDTGSYIFEMPRSLQTNSTEIDAQLEAGTAIDFGFAFWVSTSVRFWNLTGFILQPPMFFKSTLCTGSKRIR